MRKRSLGLLCLLESVPWAWGQPPGETRPQRPAISWEAARQHIGQECVVTGMVVMTRNIGSRCFLNFHENFREHFTVVINQDSFDRFPSAPETLYANKLVTVTGKVIEFQGKPEIIVTSPDQIVILHDPSTPPATQPVAKPAATPSPAPASRPASGTPAPAQPAFDGVVTVATFNVLNLFDEYDDPYHADEGTVAKPKDERERLAATFKKLNADVVALQEVENRGILEQFNRSFLAELGYREVVLFEGNDDRGIDVAVLSRFPVGPVTSYRHLTYQDANGQTQRFRRDLLRVRIEPPGAPTFDVFVVHLKSRHGGEESTVLRVAEATAARAVLDQVIQADPAACFVFCGDLNDTFDSQPLRTLIGAGPGALQALFEEIPEPGRITYNKAPYESMIDFLLCSPAMAKRYERGSYGIVAGSVESAGSDHNPVVARFKLN